MSRTFKIAAAILAASLIAAPTALAQAAVGQGSVRVAYADQDKRQGVSEAKARTLVVKPNTKPITEPNGGAKETQPAPPTKEAESLKSNVQKKADDAIAGQQQKIG